MLSVTVTRWSALESHQRALHTRWSCFTHNYISQNSLPVLIITDHIHLYLIHWLHSPVFHPVNLSIYALCSHSLTAKSILCVCISERFSVFVCLFLTLDCSWTLIIAAYPDHCLFLGFPLFILHCPVCWYFPWRGFRLPLSFLTIHVFASLH